MNNIHSYVNINRLLDENNPQKALEILNHIPDKSIWSLNARAVCFMRMNLPQSAVKALTPVVFPGNSVTVNSDVPEKIKLNLANAMLLSGNIAGALEVLQSCKEDCPLRRKLLSAVEEWKKSLPAWSRFMMLFGVVPFGKPVATPEPNGEI